MNTERMFDFLDANGRQEIIDYIQLLSDKISVLERENALLRQGMDDAFKASESLLDWAKAKRGIVNDNPWHMVNKDGYVKPLSEDKIEKLREYHGINDWMYETSIVDFVRAVEKEHGIL